MSLKKKITMAGLALALAAGGAVVTPTAAMAADPCGYFVRDGYYLYNHCGSGNAYIQDDQVVGNYQECVAPGTSIIRRPGDYGPFTPTNAFYLRAC